MRRQLLAVGVVCAAAGFARAQFNTPPNGTGGGTPVMPGQAIGTGFNFPSAGTPLPRAAPPAGNPIGSGLTRPYDPTKPLDVFKGTGIDPKSVVAPIAPAGMMKEPNLLDRLYEKLGTITGFRKSDMPVQANYTPGISRRNRERAMNRLWRRD